MRYLRSGLLLVCLAAGTPRMVLGQNPTTEPDMSAAPAAFVAPPTWLYNDLACAPTLTTQTPPALRVLGSQDTVVKRMLGPGDTLVISGGSSAGLQPGQQYFVRRNVNTFGARGPDPQHPISVHTAGWVQILGVDEAIATASVVHACEGLLLDDYLEAFTPPVIAAHTAPGTQPQYANMGHITSGDENIQNVGTGQMIGIDRGSSAGVTIGQRFLVFRDKRRMRNEWLGYSQPYVQNAHNLPLVEVAEVLVVSVRADDSTVQVTTARDSVSSGDFIAEIR
jgi:hypothetical protein